MNSSLITKYKSAIILPLALTVFLASCTGTSTTKSWVVSTFAGTGRAGKADTAAATDSTAAVEATFDYPHGVAVDSSGNIYVADRFNHLIRKITSEGVVSTFAGSTKGYHDATGEAARFFGPRAVAVDSSSGDVYVADTKNNCIRKITKEGVVTTIAGMAGKFEWGDEEGTGTAARFFNPSGVAVDSSGIVYVADTGNNRIRKITISGGVGTVTTLAGSGIVGFVDGAGDEAQFNAPFGVAVDSSDNVYVADSFNNCIRKITLKTNFKPDAEEDEVTVSTLAGNGGARGGHHDATGEAAQFDYPMGVAVDSSGNVYVTDWRNDRIRKITSEGVVSTFAGDGDTTRFDGPFGVAVDSSGKNLYVADSANNRIRKIEYK